MNFFQKFRDFVAHPTHSRTMGILLILVLASAVSLTVFVAQQQQNLKQHAAEPENNCSISFDWSGQTDSLTGGPPYNVHLITSLFSNINLADPRHETSDTNITINDVKPGEYRANICGDDGGGWQGTFGCLNLNAQTICPTANTCNKTGSICTDSATGSHTDACVGNNSLEYFCGSQNLCVTATMSCQANQTCTLNSTTTHVDCVDNSTAPPPTPFNCTGTDDDGFTFQCQASGCSSGSGWTSSLQNPNTSCSSENKTCCWKVNSPAPPPTSSTCGDFKNCASCMSDTTATCGWNGSSCVSGTRACPAGQSQWYWGSCSLNECASTKQPCAGQVGQGESYIIGPITSGRNSCCSSPYIQCPYTHTCQTQSICDASGVTLGLSLGTQDVSDQALATSDSTVTLSLRNSSGGIPTNNADVSSQTQTSRFTNSTRSNKRFLRSDNIKLTNTTPGQYLIIARNNNNMIAKSLFPLVSGQTTATAPDTTLVFGDINGDDDITISDYYYVDPATGHDLSLRKSGCYGKSTAVCTNLWDFDKKGTVDQVDYNIFLRGFATWNGEGKVSNL